jgi:hypothetical protein
LKLLEPRENFKVGSKLFEQCIQIGTLWTT